MRAERQHRGRGARETYVPYIQVRRGDFASQGRSHIFPSPFFKRQHHLLSDLELHTLWMLQTEMPWDIREQYPLQWYGSNDSFSEIAPYAQGSVEIAKQLGIKHPAFGKDDPMRMTTDLVAQRRDGTWTAHHVKYEADLDHPRNKELRAIEEAYWTARYIPFIVVTEKHVNSNVISNLAMALNYNAEKLVPVARHWVNDLIDLASQHPMNAVTQKLAERYGGDVYTHANVIKYGIATGAIKLDLTKGQLRWSSVWPAVESRLP